MGFCRLLDSCNTPRGFLSWGGGSSFENVTPASTTMLELSHWTKLLIKGFHCTFPIVNLQHNTVCEEIDISDNYVDQEGASALAHMMKENMFVVSLVSNPEYWYKLTPCFVMLLESVNTLPKV